MKANIINLQKNKTVKLVVPGSPGRALAKGRVESVAAREVHYKSSVEPGTYSLAAIYDSHTGKTYIVPASFDFYISDSDGMIACHLGLGGDFAWSRSYFDTPVSDTELDTAVARFSSAFDDEKLSQELKKISRVMLKEAAPAAFFTARSAGGSKPGKPTITGMEVVDGVVRVDLLSEGGQFTGSFWIDLKAQKVTKSVVDGREMHLNSGKPYAVPVM